MTAPALSPPVAIPADLQALAPLIPEGPSVVIEFRPPCATERLEIFEGPDGVNPLRVVKSLCRILGCSPEDIHAEPDPDHAGAREERACCYVVDDQDNRVARVAGLSFAYVHVAARALASSRWRPGRPEPVDPAGWVRTGAGA